MTRDTTKQPIKLSPVLLTSITIAVLIGAASFWGTHSKNQDTKKPITVGIVTDLSGSASYWGESTTLGANLAKQDLEKDGYKVNLKFEDYQLQAQQALTATTKLVAQDKVNAVYAEFNPAAYSLAPYLKDKNILFMYNAAPISPLKESNNFLKTYLDYQKGCQLVAQNFKNSGVQKIGSLKVNLEFGDLCDAGIRSVYGDSNTVTADYNLGDTDFKTQVFKMSQQGVGAIINTGFEGDTLNTLKVIKEQNLPIKYGTVEDTITSQVTALYGDQLKNGYSFGFENIDASFQDRIKAANGGKEPASLYGAALAYTHIQQIVKAIDKCGSDVSCSVSQVSASPADSTIGFKKFTNRIADFNTRIKSY